MSGALSGCGSNSSHTTASGDYTVAVTPATVSLGAGSSAQVSVLATASGSFTGSVGVAASGLPAGVTATPANLTLTPGVAQTVALAATATAAPGTATVMFTGTSGALVHTATAALTVSAPTPAPDFSLAVTPSASTITGGQATGTAITVTATALNGFSGSVAVALSGLPASVIANPLTLTLVPGQAQTITVLAAPAAVSGSSTVTFTGTSGTLKHAASLALTVVGAPPDFALSLTPAAQTVAIGSTAGVVVSVNAAPIGGFSSSIAVKLTGLPAGVTATPASLTLAPGTPQGVTLTAAATSVAATTTVTFTATSGTVVHTAPLALTVATAPPPDVTTYHYQNSREGYNDQETILTTANVASATFGKTAFLTTDGRVDAQPLFAANVAVNSTTTDNLVYVASEHDTVYAFSPASGQPVWTTSILGAGETTSDDHGCTQITPEIGITATPVIDRAQGAHGAIYVVGMSKDAAGGYHQRLHALDLATGAELSGSPTEIAATYAGTGESSMNGVVSFVPGQYAERAAMLLMNGSIYLSWTSHCDSQPYQGWIMAYSEATLRQTSALNITPNGGQGAIWMGGYGIAGDTTGNIYFLDGNGSFAGTLSGTGYPTDFDYGNAMMKLSTTSGKLAVADFFQPYNTIAESAADTDLGSGGGMLLPDLTDASGTIRHLMIGAGKDSNIYVADRDNMGRFNSASNAALYQELPAAFPYGERAGPAYFDNTVYYVGVSDTVKAFPISNAKLATTPSSASTAKFNYPGATPTISANGTANAIVWAVEASPSAPGILHAYDAGNLAHELYNSNQAANGRDTFGLGGKYITPMEVNGNIFVGTPTGVAVFGLLPAQ